MDENKKATNGVHKLSINTNLKHCKIKTTYSIYGHVISRCRMPTTIWSAPS